MPGSLIFTAALPLVLRYQRRCERWLRNKRIDVTSIYGPLIQELLKDRQELELLLSFDTSLLWNRFCLVEVALVYGGRALPMAWKVLELERASVSFTDYAPLLKQVKAMLVADCSICLLADRGEAHQALLCANTAMGLALLYPSQGRPSCPSGYEGNHSVPVNPLTGRSGSSV